MPSNRWSQDEDAKLVQAVKDYKKEAGVLKWETIAKQMASARTPTSISVRYTILSRSPAATDTAAEVITPPFTVTEIEQEFFKNIREMARAVSCLGKGRVEGVYQAAMGVELQKKNIPHTMEQVIPIVYEDVAVGHERCDINIRGNVPCVLELKATSCPIQPKEHWQAISYMRSLGRTFGAVINFNQSPTGRLLMDFILLKDGKPYLWNLDTCTPLSEPMNDY